MACAPSQCRVSQAEASTETGLPDGVNEAEPQSFLLVTGTQESSSQTTVIAAIDSVEAISENNDQKDPSSVDGLPKANDQSDVDQKCISIADASNHGGNKGYRSSFTWGTFMKGKRDPQPESTDNEDPSVVSRNSQPYMTLTSTPSKSEQRSSGFHELASTFCVPLFMKDKLTKRDLTKNTDRWDTPSKRPHQKSDCREEWNAIKRSISDILAEKENQVLIPYSSTLSGSPASSTVGNRLRQDCTSTVSPPKLHSQEIEIQNVTKGGTLNSEGKEERKPSDIMAQIAKIEEFMSSEGLTPQKRPKIE
ncbi:uncharacterized protein LOC127640419 [Xyrauchen texanus]|uniref:uncharacterized protein LOC127640419 n=1 Tax=Xyrauchen texanus TaxID=154827 RepID=UPI00224192BC|nr:uncharacterized protein LOC127640419 [Xyrauchen texanus]